MIKQRSLIIAVFFSGLTSLALEMVASRLLGNYFGASNLVWASIIGLIMLYLTAGYFLGGIWADRSPKPRTFFQILLWAGFSIALVPLVGRPLLAFAADAFDHLEMGVLFGSFVVMLILFVVPVVLLGTASPFAIRLAITDASHVGAISGRLYAISTLGSFIGTFLPVLLLVPTIGTFRTFLTISAILVVVAWVVLAVTCGRKWALIYAWMPLVIAVLFVLGVRGTDKAPEGMVYETESAYNYIQVIQQNGFAELRLNEGQGVHSIYHPTELNFKGPWEQVLAAPFFNAGAVRPEDVHSMAIVGLAAGTTARDATAVFGSQIQIDGYEIDPEIVRVGREYFGMTEPNLSVFVEDGRWGLAHSPRKYQVISVDAYRPPYIPAHMTTREFFQLARAHLTDDGVLVINVGRAAGDRRLVDAMSSTIGSVFPSVYVMDVPDTFNSILYATVQPTQLSNLRANTQALIFVPKTHPLLLYSLQTALNHMQPVKRGAQVFTDDQSPIEWITNSMIFDFFVSGNVENLQ